MARKKLYNNSDEYWDIKEAIKEIYEMPSGYDREQRVKNMRTHLLETYGDDPEAKYIRENDLKYY